MAADEEKETSTSKKVTSPNVLKTGKCYDENITSISYTDFTCPICLQILIEPVVMPCEHELCGLCFKQNVQEANFLCPLCRMRISSWARRNSRNGTLVDLKRWEQIQKLFPEKCQKRLRGEDDEDLFVDSNKSLLGTTDTPPLKRAISQEGEVRKEYEEEMRKLRQAREQEMQASEEVVRQLLEEEQRLAQSIEHQALQDEELAKQILLEEKEQNSHRKEMLSQPSSSKTSSTAANPKQGKGKKIKSQKTQPTHHGCSTLHRWFSPTRQPDNQGSEKSRCDLVKNKNHWSATDSDKSGLNYLSHDISDLINERKEQEDRDFQFALKLQKEFDLANKKDAEVERKKGSVDGYMLRSENCSKNSD